MLLAAGQQQMYSYSPKSSSRLTLSSASKSNERWVLENASIKSRSTNHPPEFFHSLQSSTASSRYSLMKSLSAHLNRGTEMLKQTVQRAILSKMTTTEPLTVSPTYSHRHPTTKMDDSSEDSLRIEMCHLRPIRSYPLTPRRRFIPIEIKVPLPRKLGSSFSSGLKIPSVKAKIQKNLSLSAFCVIKPISVAAVVKTPSPKKSKGCELKAKAEPKRLKRKAPQRKNGRRKVAVKLAEAKTRNGLLADKEKEAQERKDFEFAKKLQQELDASDIGNCAASSKPVINGLRKRTRSQANAEETGFSNNINTYSLRNKKKSESVEPPPKKNGFTETTATSRRTTAKRRCAK